MKKFKIGLSFFILVIFCILLNRFLLLINYLLALFLHEMAHLLVAVKRGYTLKIVKLDMFGLSVELGEKINNEDNFAINIAGPLCNLLLSVICVAMYWLVPASFKILNTFCFANLALALFNLLPIYPLDGGKIVSSLVKEERVYKKIDKVIRCVLSVLFLVLFVLSTFKVMNLFLLIIVVFLLTSRTKKAPTLSIFKYTKPKTIEKVVLVKANEDASLFSLIKQIKQHCYTIFYYKNERNNYIDQDTIIDYATKLPLTTTIKEIY